MKVAEIQNFFFLQLMAIMWLVDCQHNDFCLTNYISTRECYVNRPKKAYFSLITWLSPYGTVQAPRSKLLTLGRPPG